MRPAGKQKKLNPQEKKVNKILSNQNAREILKSRAITAINSQVLYGQWTYIKTKGETKYFSKCR